MAMTDQSDYTSFFAIGTAALSVLVGGTLFCLWRYKNTNRPSIEDYHHVLGSNPALIDVESNSVARMLTYHSTASPGKQKGTLVFLHGFGCTSLEWKDVITIVQEDYDRFDIFTYDRILFVQNGKALQDRTAEQLAQELHYMLRKKEIPEPYILVGHSYGGLIAQVFANEFKSLVRGLVLVDHSHPRQFEHLPTDFAMGFLYTVPLVLKTYSYVASTGILKLMDRVNAFNFPPIYLWPSTSPYRAAARELYSDNDVWVLSYRELMGIFAGRKKQEVTPLPTCPVGVVIAANRKDSPTFFPQAVTDTFIKLHQPLWKAAGNKLFLGTKSDHWVHITEPELVVEALDYVLSRVEGDDYPTTVVVDEMAKLT